MLAVAEGCVSGDGIGMGSECVKNFISLSKFEEAIVKKLGEEHVNVAYGKFCPVPISKAPPEGTS